MNQSTSDSWSMSVNKVWHFDLNYSGIVTIGIMILIKVWSVLNNTSSPLNIDLYSKTA